MFIESKRIYGTRVEGTDGAVGTIRDLLFDDQTWKIRYIVVETGNWFHSRHALISPEAVDRADWTARRLVLHRTRQQVQESPGEESHLSVAQRGEREAAGMIAWDGYWAGLFHDAGRIEGDPHLRNTKAVTGHHVEGSDGQIGHVEDFLIDDRSWTIPYLVAGTRNWLPGKRVVIAPTWVESISWEQRKVRVAMSRDKIEHGPQYDPSALGKLQDEHAVEEHHPHLSV
jgi:hypothetical protein